MKRILPIALTLALAVSLVVVPAAPAAAATVSVSSALISRSSESGNLVYSVTAAASGYLGTGDVCEFYGWGCTLVVEARYAAGGGIISLGSLGAIWSSSSISHEFSGSLEQPELYPR